MSSKRVPWALLSGQEQRRLSKLVLGPPPTSVNVEALDVTEQNRLAWVSEERERAEHQLERLSATIRGIQIVLNQATPPGLEAAEALMSSAAALAMTLARIDRVERDALTPAPPLEPRRVDWRK